MTKLPPLPDGQLFDPSKNPDDLSDAELQRATRNIAIFMRDYFAGLCSTETIVYRNENGTVDFVRVGEEERGDKFRESNKARAYLQEDPKWFLREIKTRYEARFPESRTNHRVNLVENGQMKFNINSEYPQVKAALIAFISFCGVAVEAVSIPTAEQLGDALYMLQWSQSLKAASQNQDNISLIKGENNRLDLIINGVLDGKHIIFTWPEDELGVVHFAWGASSMPAEDCIAEYDEDLISRLSDMPEDTSITPGIRENFMVSTGELEECLQQEPRGLVHLHESDFILAVNNIMANLGLLNGATDIMTPPNIQDFRSELMNSGEVHKLISWMCNELKDNIGGEFSMIVDEHGNTNTYSISDADTGENLVILNYNRDEEGCPRNISLEFYGPNGSTYSMIIYMNTNILVNSDQNPEDYRHFTLQWNKDGDVSALTCSDAQDINCIRGEVERVGVILPSAIVPADDKLVREILTTEIGKHEEGCIRIEKDSQFYKTARAMRHWIHAVKRREKVTIEEPESWLDQITSKADIINWADAIQAKLEEFGNNNVSVHIERGRISSDSIRIRFCWQDTDNEAYYNFVINEDDSADLQWNTGS